MTYLPDEILSMVCTQIWLQQDFNTLFNCACSGKRLAAIAVIHLYRTEREIVRSWDYSDGSVNYADGYANHYLFDKLSDLIRPERMNRLRKSNLSMDRISKKRVGLWQTIVLSSLEKTLYPYSQYIQALDLSRLGLLLIHSMSSAQNREDFFQGELAKFTARSGAEIIAEIGEAITKQTPLLEELTVDVLSGALTRWIPRLPRLTTLAMPCAEANEDIGTVIRLHCPSFKALHLIESPDLDSQSLAACLNELHPQSIESFKFSTSEDPGSELFQSLNCHGESLTELSLQFGFFERSIDIALIKGCTNLVSLYLVGTEPLYQGNFSETFTWLKEFRKLRTLTLLHSIEPVLIAPILLENSIHLISLEYESLQQRDTKFFCQALANQTSLQILYLKGSMDEDGYTVKETDTLVESLTKLVNLTELYLDERYNFLADRHIVQLANSLPKLEVWSTWGNRLTDDIWGEIASLRSLRSLEFLALMSFTAKSILDFIEQLGPGNKGLVLSLMYDKGNQVDRAWDEPSFSPEELLLIRKTIAKKVEGRFCLTRMGRRDDTI